MSKLMDILKGIKACDTDQPYIFISYSSADSELVWQDVLEFQKRGYNVWLDEKNLDKTKKSWKEDALTAIEDMDCQMVVFYVSESSLCSEACYRELSKTIDERTKALHFGPVKFIAIDVQEVGDIMDFSRDVYETIRNSSLSKTDKQSRALVLNGFVQSFFNSNNEKVRIHPRNERNRKMDYYEEIISSFPDNTCIYPAKEAQSECEVITGPEPEVITESEPEMVTEPEADAITESGNGSEHASQLEQEVYSQPEPGINSGAEDVSVNGYIRQLQSLAEQGNSNAQYELGKCYYKGLYVKKDVNIAGEWFWKAANNESPNVNACFELGELYYKTIDSNGTARTILMAGGTMFIPGVGLLAAPAALLGSNLSKRAKIKAYLKTDAGKNMIELYQKAAAFGHEKAQKRLKELHKYQTEES